MMKAKRKTNKYKNSRQHINGIVVIGSFRLFPSDTACVVVFAGRSKILFSGNVK
jgi:hypothetical protein